MHHRTFWSSEKAGWGVAIVNADGTSFIDGCGSDALVFESEEEAEKRAVELRADSAIFPTAIVIPLKQQAYGYEERHGLMHDGWKMNGKSREEYEENGSS